MKFKTIKPISEVKQEKKASRWLKRSFYFFTATLLLTGAYTTYEFINTHDFQSPILIKLQNPTPRKIIKIESPVGSKSAGIINQAYAEEKTPEQMTNEEYICWKFGEHCKTAVAIAKAESGLRDEAVNPNNSNGTIDIGCWQVNSVHLKKKTITIAELLDCKKATDWVYEDLYKHQGFSPWVAFNTGAYLAKLEE